MTLRFPARPSLRRALSLVALVLLPSLGACGDDGDASSTTAPVSLQVGPAGGQFALAGGVTVSVPPGAVSQPVQLGVTTNAAGTGIDDTQRVGPVFEFTPAGTTFAVPVEVSVPVEGSGASAPLFLTRAADGRIAGVARATIEGGRARGLLDRLGPVWVSDRGARVAQLELTVPAHDLQSGNTISLDVRATNLVGGLVPVDGVAFASSDPTVATVSADGLVTGVRSGTTTISATLQSVNASIALTVSAGDVASLELLPAEFEVARRAAVQLAVVARDAAGNVVATPARLRFTTADPSVVRVDETGQVSGIGGGSTTVQVIAGEVTGSATANVPPPIPSALRIVSRAPSVGMGETIQVRAQTLDEFGEVIRDGAPEITWSSSNGTIATIDDDGVVSGAGLGSTRIRASSEAGSDEVDLVVGPGRPSAISITVQPATVQEGQQFSPLLAVSIADAFGNETPQAGISISVAVVQGSGTLVGTTTVETDAEGRATFTDLRLDGGSGGVAHILEFTSPGLVGVRSNSFMVLPPPKWLVVSGGGESRCGITDARKVLCWGRDTYGYGVFGDGTDSSVFLRLTPGPIASDLEFTQVASSFWGHCALSTTGDIWCWGARRAVVPPGLPIPSGVNGSSVPEKVVGGHTFVSLYGGSRVMCGRTVAGEMLCWGSNTRGMLGFTTATSESILTPTPFTANTAELGSAKFVQASFSTAHGCALTDGGDIFCAGSNTNGEIGHGFFGFDVSPARKVDAGATKFTKVETGLNGTCALDTAGKSWCWGNGWFGRIGNGLTTGENPYQVTRPLPVTYAGTFKDLAVADGGRCALDSVTGEAWCWGNGGLGNNNASSENKVPGPVSGGLAFDWIRGVSGGTDTFCAKETGKDQIWCWGFNFWELMADTPPFVMPVPTKIRNP